MHVCVFVCLCVCVAEWYLTNLWYARRCGQAASCDDVDDDYDNFNTVGKGWGRIGKGRLIDHR